MRISNSGNGGIERSVPCLRLFGAAMLTAGMILTGLGSTVAAEPSEGACVQRAEAVRAKVIRDFGGDNINFNFFKRADRARELCRSGQAGEAMNILAAIKSDLRGLYKERWEN